MKKIVTALFVLIAIFSLTAVAVAIDTTPGAEGDPVVTKSYVDTQIAKLNVGSSTGASYKAVKLTAGQKMIGNEGTEIILRSGEASALDNGANGVSDLTGAADLMTGQTVVQNHLLLVPRSDGRGVYAITDIYVMVRGTYTIQ